MSRDSLILVIDDPLYCDLPAERIVACGGGNILGHNKFAVVPSGHAARLFSAFFYSLVRPKEKSHD
jgi:hypothetical protein